MPTTPTREGAGSTQTKIVVPGSQAMVSLLGSRDELLRIIEEALASDIHVRGNEITLSGDPADNALVVRLFEELLELVAAGQALTADAVERSARDAARPATAERPAEVLTLNILSNRGRTIRPKTLNQKRYVDAIDRHTDRLRHRPGRHRQDLPGDGQGRAGAAGQAGQPDHPDPAGGRGGGAARLPARHAVREDRPVPAAAATTRCTTWSTRSRSRG